MHFQRTTGQESRAALKLVDGSGNVKDLSSVAGVLTWDGVALVTPADLSAKVVAPANSGLTSLGNPNTGRVEISADTTILTTRSQLNTDFALKQDTLTVANGLTLTGATLGCAPIQNLVAGASGLSLGTGTGASQRVAVYESGSQYFYGVGLFEGASAGLGVGTGIWGGTGASTPDQFGTGGVLPQVLITYNNTVGINNRAPTEALTVTGNILATGSITGSSKSWDIPHPDPAKPDMRLRHFCTESDDIGGSVNTGERST